MTQQKIRTQTLESIDWVSVTYPHNTPMNQIIMGDVRLERIKSPIPVYSLCYLAQPYGYKILSSPHDRLGIHVIFSGKPLRALGKDGITPRHIYNVIRANNGKVSRLDIAYDIFNNDEITVDEIRARIKASQAITSMDATKVISSLESAETIYLGNMTSRSRRFRIYDKQVESQTDFKWLRFEYEKRRNSDNMIDRIMQGDNTIQGIIRGVIDIPQWQAWQEIFDTAPESILRGTGKISDIDLPEEIMNEITAITDEMLGTLNWIHNSAIPAILKVLEMEYVNSGCDDSIFDNGIVANTVNGAMERGILGIIQRSRK